MHMPVFWGDAYSVLCPMFVWFKKTCHEYRGVNVMDFI